MTARTAFGKHLLAPQEQWSICCQIAVSSRSIFQFVRRGGLEEEQRQVWSLGFRRLPVTRVFPRVGNLYWRNRFPANQRLEMQQPFFAKQTDIEEDAIEGSQWADGIGSVFQHASGQHRIRRLEERRQRTARDIVVELLVI